MPEYIPPKVWKENTVNGGRFSTINKPTSGAQEERVLAVGKHPMQLYSLGTPNGVKVTIMLEELLALGHEGAEYDAHLINIGEGAQFGSDFVAINPNSKIPALLDHSTSPPTRVFESAAILIYLAEKFGAFILSILHNALNVFHGSCGKWVLAHFLAEALDISMPMRRKIGISD